MLNVKYNLIINNILHNIKYNLIWYFNATFPCGSFSLSILVCIWLFIYSLSFISYSIFSFISLVPPLIYSYSILLSSLGKKDYNKKTEVKEEDKEGKEVEYKKIN